APAEALARVRPLLVDEHRRLAARYLEDGAIDALKLGLSRLADGLVVGLVELARQSVIQQGEIPRDERARAETMIPPLTVIAIGEHGGRWLAPASRLDLVFAVPKHGSHATRARAIADFVMRGLEQLGCPADATVDTPQRCLEQAVARPQFLERL